ncbi:DUF4240 domain-containing protein [Shewanella maritima]|uniref:DUF4240 domain-containing protein n=1 Tax=Shewanella maritima TaxID=2520507 RepID=UPI003736982F
MTEEQFWQIVTRGSAQQSSQECIARLSAQLQTLNDEELTAFDKMLGQQLRRSYLWSVWGAAYVITGCDSEHMFTEFQCFLLSLGQDVYEDVIVNPDNLAKLEQWPLKDDYPYPFIEDFDLIAGQIFEDRTGDELPFVPAGTHSPAGKKFNNKPKFLRKAYPQLAAAFPF